MPIAENYLALDIGAGSGRVMLGRFDGQSLALTELHRFDNSGVETLDGLQWDVLALFAAMKNGIRKAAGQTPVSLGVDTWGVDFALLDKDGALIGNPRHYRDTQKDGAMDRALAILPRDEVFRQTGLQFMEINSLYQLFARKGTVALDRAAALLMMPDLFHYWFTGRMANEYTDATTSQCFNPRERRWAPELLDRLGLPTSLFQEVIQPATEVGPLHRTVAEECGVSGMSVIAPGTHDTASAVAAVPATAGDWAYLSSGTWSLLGLETPEPLVTDAALAKNFTNEGGVAGTNRLLKNICGMWLLEECRREWSRRGFETSYERLLADAAQAQPFRSLIQPDDARFAPQGDMPGRIRTACEESGQPAPESTGQFARCIFESLALRYRDVLADAAQIAGRNPTVLHIVGGGSQNEMLCQFTADACAMEVIAGPVEATATGNVLLQAMARDRIADLAQLRQVSANSFPTKRYQPHPNSAWQQAQLPT